MIYADFESILVPEDNGMQNLNKSYANKYQKHIACSYGYKLVYVLMINKIKLNSCQISQPEKLREKYMSSNNLSFIDSFQFPGCSLDSLVKKLAKDDFKYLSQEFDKNVLDLVKQKGFYPYEYMSDFEKFKEQLPSKEKFYSLLTGKKISDKKYEHVLEVRNKFEMKTMKDYHDFYLKCNVLLLADVFEKCRNNC